MDFSDLKKWKIKKKNKNIYKVQYKNKFYIGELKNYKPDGIGYYHSNIENYKGYWKEGKKNGYGYTFDKNGNKIYSGHWKDNSPNGKGILFYEKNKIKYSGYFKDNFYSGEGRLYNKDGNLLYKGNFLNSKYNGKGILYNTNNSKKYDGFWVNNERDGMGKEYDYKGNLIYEGEFKNNKRNGYGYKFSFDFPYNYSYWKDGKQYNLYKQFPKSFYEIKSFIGQGGFGKLSLYKDKNTNKLYAVKFFKTEMDLIVQYRNLKYLQENKVCKPYFLCPYGIFYHYNKFCLVFNYLEGYITFEKFRKNKLIEKKDKIKICSQMWYEINLLHKIGMIHCDIKSSNIMIHPETFKVHIIDFGVAIIIDKKDKEKKYIVYGITKKYFNLPLGRKYNFKQLIKNDLNTMSKIIYLYLNNYKKETLPSFESRLDFIQNNLKMNSPSMI